VGQVKAAAVASRRLGLKAHATFSGALAWPYFYPWPQRPAGLIEEAFAELGRRWKPILDVFERTASTSPTRSIRARTCTTARPSSASWTRSAAIRAPTSSTIPATSCCSNWTIWATSTAITSGSKPSTSRTPSSGPTAQSGVYGGYQGWAERPGRFRSLGDGQVDFKAIFSKLAQYDFDGWAVLEWECALKHPEQGAREGAPFIRDHIIQVTDKAFDDFAGSAPDAGRNRRLLGL
jgi:hypothetical protein